MYEPAFKFKYVCPLSPYTPPSPHHLMLEGHSQSLLHGSELLPLCHPQSLPVKGLLVCGNLSSFTAPSHWCRSRPYSFVSVFSFFFCPTLVPGEFLAFWEVWVLLPALSGCSIGAVPRVDVFLMYLWEGRWSPRLTLPPYSPPSPAPIIEETVFSPLHIIASCVID